MAYTASTTRVTGELITASIWNTDIVDNIDALKTPPQARYVLNEGADITSSTITFVDVDAANLSLTITTTGGNVKVRFVGNIKSSTGKCYLDVDVDSSRYAGDDGILGMKATGSGDPGDPISFEITVTGLAAGPHTFKLQWKVNAGTATLFAGAGTSDADVHGVFEVSEEL